MFKKQLLVTAVVAATLTGSLTLAGNVLADKKSLNFHAIDSSASSADWDPTALWKLPKGFSQKVVSDESSSNIYNGGRDDWK